MYTNLIFIILVILLLSFTPGQNSIDPLIAFKWGLLFYGITQLLIILQSILVSKHPKRWERFAFIFTNLELLLFLGIYHFTLSSERAYAFLPHSFSVLISLLLYFLGLFTHYAVFHKITYHNKFSSSLKFALKEVQFLIPFILPFVFLILFIDLLQSFGGLGWEETPLGSLFFILGILTLLFLIMLFLPFLIQKIWRCQPLNNPELESRLNIICQKAKFKHAGFKIWTLLNRSLTAAIIGLIPRYRYIMFTKRLLADMPPEQIEAIVAHEIGHSYRKHLWIYPFILLGMSTLLLLFTYLSQPALNEMWRWLNLHYPRSLWLSLFPFVLFIPYALLIALYFRYVFGFFSRLFERQADLHVYVVGVDPNHLIAALDFIADKTGGIHRLANWHHHSIYDRIEFLKATEKDPSLIKKHHRWVKTCLLFYSFIFVSIIALLLAPF